MSATHENATVLERQIGTSGSYTAVAGVVSISRSGESKETHDVTTLVATNMIRSFITGLIDPGEVTLELLYEDITSQDDLRTDLLASTDHGYQIVLPASINKTWTFQGIITNIGEDFPVDGAISRAVTIKVSGAMTIA